MLLVVALPGIITKIHLVTDAEGKTPGDPVARRETPMITSLPSTVSN